MRWSRGATCIATGRRRITWARSPSRSDAGPIGTRRRGCTPAKMPAEPLALDDYHRSRWIVEPLRLFDCCLVSNGGLAVIVTGSERARNLRKPPVYIWGMGQGHLGGDPADTLTSGAVLA